MNMTEAAFKFISEAEEPLTFQQLWKKVSKELKMNKEEAEKNISRFYTQISMDDKFVMLEENHWDLKNKHPYEKSHIDMNEIYLEDVEDEVDEKEENEEEKLEESFEEDEFEKPEVDTDEDFGFHTIDDEDEEF